MGVTVSEPGSTEVVDFDAFVGPHLSAMWALASRLAGPDARDDVLQDALLTAWRRWRTYDASRGTARTWLLLLVNDRCRKHWRGLRPTAELVDTALPERDVAAHLDVSRAVAQLPPRQRLAVELFYVLGLPVAECALVMRCATGTVSSTLSDARRALRSKLEVTS
jgi:RNA polymerase sigma-70 factor (ECF subfamily)